MALSEADQSIDRVISRVTRLFWAAAVGAGLELAIVISTFIPFAGVSIIFSAVTALGAAAIAASRQPSL